MGQWSLILICSGFAFAAVPIALLASSGKAPTWNGHVCSLEVDETHHPLHVLNLMVGPGSIFVGLIVTFMTISTRGFVVMVTGCMVPVCTACEWPPLEPCTHRSAHLILLTPRVRALSDFLVNLQTRGGTVSPVPSAAMGVLYMLGCFCGGATIGCMYVVMKRGAAIKIAHELEQLRSEKERLDYERRFALHQMRRGQGGAAREDDHPSSSRTDSSVAAINTRNMISCRLASSLPPGPPSSSSSRSVGEQEMAHTFYVASDPAPRLAPSEAVTGQGGNLVRSFWYALPPIAWFAPHSIRALPPSGGKPPPSPHSAAAMPAPFGGKPPPSPHLAAATSTGKRRFFPACASEPAPSPCTADPERTIESTAARVPVLDRLLAELEQITMVEQMTEQEQLDWREDWTRLTQGRGSLPALLAEVASVEGDVLPEEDAGQTDRQTSAPPKPRTTI